MTKRTRVYHVELTKGKDIPYGKDSPEEYANRVFLEFKEEFSVVSLTKEEKVYDKDGNSK